MPQQLWNANGNLIILIIPMVREEESGERDHLWGRYYYPKDDLRRSTYKNSGERKNVELWSSIYEN